MKMANGSGVNLGHVFMILKKDAEDANSDYRDDVTEHERRGCKRQSMGEEFGRGGTEVGLKTANMILSNSMTEDRVKKCLHTLKDMKLIKMLKDLDQVKKVIHQIQGLPTR